MLWCLHGFLGKPSDWDFLDLQNLHTPNLHHASQAKPFWNWAEDFNQTVVASAKSGSASGGPILLGYSMGSRLALHALLQAPKMWRGAIIVSAHAGLQSAQERTMRVENDAKLAEDFLQQPWAEIMKKWHSREMFGKLPPPTPRRETEYSREMLAFALTTWSLGRQDFLLPRLKEITCPVLWVAGEKEEKFVQQAKAACEVLPNAEVWIAKDCYHRVPWEKPEEFLEKVAVILSAAKNPG